MVRTILTCLALAFCCAGCTQKPATESKVADKKLSKDSAIQATSAEQAPSPIQNNCKSQTSLVFEDAGLSSFTEDNIRGAGVISFRLNTNDRLDILNLDGSVFGGIVVNEDGNYFTLTMPQKTTARNLIPNQDFEAFDFDAEPVAADPDYLLIYVNKEKRKVKKDGIRYTFHTWTQYLLGNTIHLRPCNLLKDAKGSEIKNSIEQIFEITAVHGDWITIKSINDCQSDGPYQNIQGRLKWRANGALLIDFTSCE